MIDSGKMNSFRDFWTWWRKKSSAHINQSVMLLVKKAKYSALASGSIANCTSEKADNFLSAKQHSERRDAAQTGRFTEKWLRLKKDIFLCRVFFGVYLLVCAFSLLFTIRNYLWWFKWLCLFAQITEIDCMSLTSFIRKEFVIRCRSNDYSLRFRTYCMRFHLDVKSVRLAKD